ncbi:uncharacterized protein LOC111246532 [Varroa destructor]|uniref:Uncharacterized protein n=1 Tax=Varroa destructor TaxID=109461 RepID=A0A7M7JL01_VARDE|nr:uncharacterized protein LOC111246532 [Varroa destructor]
MLFRENNELLYVHGVLDGPSGVVARLCTKPGKDGNGVRTSKGSCKTYRGFNIRNCKFGACSQKLFQKTCNRGITHITFIPEHGTQNPVVDFLHEMPFVGIACVGGNLTLRELLS